MNIGILIGREIAENDNEKMCFMATRNNLEKQNEVDHKDNKAETHRTVFRRDRDRILYSGGFRRLQDKTQVMAAVKTGDHRTRLTHSLEVEQIATSIADALKLNRDLTSAIALGHDVGHTPFGHAVERFLNRKLKNEGGFSHALESVRYLNDKVKNLSDEIIEGVLKHDTDAFVYDYEENGQLIPKDSYYVNQPPGTLEAQVVYWADKIAYITHDYDDFKKNLLNKLIEDKDIKEEKLEEIFSKLLKKDDFKLSEFETRDLVRNITTNLIYSSKKNIIKCFGEQELGQFDKDNKIDKQNHIREKTFNRIKEGYKNNEEYVFLKELKLNNKMDKEIIIEIKKIYEFYKVRKDSYMIKKIDELKAYIDERIILENEIENMSNIEILKNQKKINRYKELCNIKMDILDKRVNKIEKESYQANLIINLSDEYRDSYLELRKKIDKYYIGSPEIQLSDAKAESIVSPLFDMYYKNIKILPNDIREKINKEIKSMKCNEGKDKQIEIKKIHTRNIASYIASMSDRYAEQIYMDLNSTGSHYDY